jgi:hypothetical protein
VAQELQKRFSFEMPPRTNFGDEGYESEEVAWSGWSRLQEAAVAALGEEKLPHLLAMEAWQGVYLPIQLTPCEFHVQDETTPLQCASLLSLVQELQLFASERDLPVDEMGLQALWEHYTDDEDLIDEDLEIQTYAQLMLAAAMATAHRMPLWVVK